MGSEQKSRTYKGHKSAEIILAYHIFDTDYIAKEQDLIIPEKDISLPENKENYLSFSIFKFPLSLNNIQNDIAELNKNLLDDRYKLNYNFNIDKNEVICNITHVTNPNFKLDAVYRKLDQNNLFLLTINNSYEYTVERSTNKIIFNQVLNTSNPFPP